MRLLFILSKIVLFVLVLFAIATLFPFPPGQALTPNDNAHCDLRNLTEAGTRLKLEAPNSAELGKKVTIKTDINTSTFGDYQQYESIRLCIRDSKSRDWSEKKAQWTIRTLQLNYSFSWDTTEARSNQSTAENPHIIRVIAIPSNLFGVNKPIYDKEKTIILTKTSPGGDEGGDGIITSPVPPGPGGGDDTPPPLDGQPDDTKDGTGTANSSPQFGADTLRQYLAGLVNPKSAEEFVIAVVEFLFSMLAFAAFIAFLVGGIQYMTALGNEEKAATGKRTLVYAVIGLIISLSFVAVLSIFSGQLRELFK